MRLAASVRPVGRTDGRTWQAGHLVAVAGSAAAACLVPPAAAPQPQLLTTPSVGRSQSVRRDCIQKCAAFVRPTGSLEWPGGSGVCRSAVGRSERKRGAKSGGGGGGRRPCKNGSVASGICRKRVQERGRQKGSPERMACGAEASAESEWRGMKEGEAHKSHACHGGHGGRSVRLGPMAAVIQ